MRRQDSTVKPHRPVVSIARVRFSPQRQSGAVAVLVAVVLLPMLFFAALAIDVGYAKVTKNELQNVADGAALAGARMLGRLYECNGDINNCVAPMPYEQQLTYNADEAQIKLAAVQVGLANEAGGKSGITIRDIDIVIGIWDPINKKIDPVTSTSPDAVQVIARRDGLANNPISTFLAGIMDKPTLDVSAVATAALTGASTVGPGGLPIPIAINKTWMSKLPCNEDLELYPSSGDVCSAWHAYTKPNAYQPTSANRERNLLKDVAAGQFSSPETIAGVTKYEITNGTMASLFNTRGNETSSPMQNLFDVMKVKNDGLLDDDQNSDTWTTSIPIFDDTVVGCHPTQALTIVGFTTVTITEVIGPPDNKIKARITCQIVEPGRGGGGYYGTKGSIPGLVQ